VPFSGTVKALVEPDHASDSKNTSLPQKIVPPHMLPIPVKPVPAEFCKWVN